MAIHDAYARRTPYELFLPDEDFAGKHFTAVEAEAEERGVSDLSDPDRFVMLMAAGEALRELKGPEDDPERIRQHGLLLFHAYHFRAAGEPLWLLPTATARYLVEGSAPPDPEPLPPSPAGYLQLPQHLFWGRLGGDGGDDRGAGGGDAATAPESVDGISWVEAGGRLSVLAVLGVRGDRPGFSVVPLPPVPLSDAPTWISTAMRGGGAEDFRSDLPGAELDSLYELRTAGEVLKLLARAFGLMDAGTTERLPPPGGGPGKEADEPGAGGEAAGEAAGGPPPSGLPFYRISLD